MKYIRPSYTQHCRLMAIPLQCICKLGVSPVPPWYKFGHPRPFRRIVYHKVDYLWLERVASAIILTWVLGPAFLVIVVIFDFPMRGWVECLG